ncbi:hypothetical protein JCM24511_06810 [Saitozyma sp. JCM 24511]|nr:hypothetical protein JCM24511_06810 [Saitozyma sp. JCM 24511]
MVLLALTTESLDVIAEDEAALEMDEIVDETEDESEDEAAEDDDDAAGMSMIVVLPNDTGGDQSSPVQSSPVQSSPVQSSPVQSDHYALRSTHTLVPVAVRRVPSAWIERSCGHRERMLAIQWRGRERGPAGGIQVQTQTLSGSVVYDAWAKSPPKCPQREPWGMERWWSAACAVISTVSGEANHNESTCEQVNQMEE